MAWSATSIFGASTSTEEPSSHGIMTGGRPESLSIPEMLRGNWVSSSGMTLLTSRKIADSRTPLPTLLLRPVAIGVAMSQIRTRENTDIKIAPNEESTRCPDLVFIRSRIAWPKAEPKSWPSPISKISIPKASRKRIPTWSVICSTNGATPRPMMNPARIPTAESKDANPPWRQPLVIAARTATTMKPSTIQAGSTNSPLSVYCVTYRTLLDPPLIITGGRNRRVQIQVGSLIPLLLPAGF